MPISRRLINFFIVVFLVGCSSVNTTAIPNLITPQLANPAPTVNDFETPTPVKNDPLPTSTLDLDKTPDITQTVYAQNMISTRSAEKTLVAQYPHDCDLFSGIPEFSPNGLWMGVLCYSDDGEDYILVFSNRENQNQWKLSYKEHMPRINNFPDGGMSIVHWSNDGRYAYFYSFLGGDGGECYMFQTNSGVGLFRIDLQTGSTSAILPKNDVRTSWYTFSFSPTDRRLVYGITSRNLKIFDLSTGELTNVVSVNDFSQSGGYLWSPDGLQFVYSTVTTLDNWETRSYSLRLVDTLSGTEQIILDSPDRCFVARLWSEDNVLTVENHNEDHAQALYDQVLIEIDLKSNKIISEATITPFP